MSDHRVTKCVFILTLAFLCFAATAQGYQYPLTSGAHRLARTTYGSEERLAISGTRVVYAGFGNGHYVHGNWVPANWDIYCYDLKTGKERRLTTSEANQTHPAISGTKVVWQDDRNAGYDIYDHWTDNYDIYCYDLTTGKEKRLTASAQDQTNPAISGTTVVWEDGRGVYRWDIHSYDLATGKEITVTPNWWWQGDPDISGTTVVWDDDRNYVDPEPDDDWWMCDIYSYDLATGEESRLTTSTTARYPAISGTRVVYQDKLVEYSGNYDIFCYDLATGEAKRLTTNAHAQTDAAIAGNNVVWADDRNGWPTNSTSPPFWHSQWDIYYYNLATDRVMRLTTSKADQTGPVVSGTKVVWRDYRDGKASIYCYELKPAATLGTPVAPSEMYHGRRYTVYGTLKPQHTADSKVGWLQCDRYYSGAWHRTRTFTMTSKDYSTYSRYKAYSVRLPYHGKWRVRAYHYDAAHAASFSKWRYITVR